MNPGFDRRIRVRALNVLERSGTESSRFRTKNVQEQEDGQKRLENSRTFSSILVSLGHLGTRFPSASPTSHRKYIGTMPSFYTHIFEPNPCSSKPNPSSWMGDGGYHTMFMIGQYVAVHGDVISHVNVTGVRVEDGGTYECTATNRIGEARHSTQLNVYGAPHVRPMGDISAIAGETLRVSCPVGGYPVDTIQWLRGENTMPRPLKIS
ncbi:hypothetical protein J437_LFUL006812 [Ladona fulva]|uniref:Ig-like domain-containing protein n=1 Tax=Ladona fulva TaxID=123851 RepID=A0A8K0K4T2_LADFU|nr:hypothetical protein J437_LFUL006812 [Ladona fulva]